MTRTGMTPWVPMRPGETQPEISPPDAALEQPAPVASNRAEKTTARMSVRYRKPALLSLGSAVDRDVGEADEGRQVEGDG